MTTLAEYEEAEAESRAIQKYRRGRDHLGRFVRLCADCHIYPADKPSRLCPGCEAYRDHLR